MGDDIKEFNNIKFQIGCTFGVGENLTYSKLFTAHLDDSILYLIGVLIKHLDVFCLFFIAHKELFVFESFETLTSQSDEGLKDKVLKSAHHGYGGQVGYPWA